LANKKKKKKVEESISHVGYNTRGRNIKRRKRCLRCSEFVSNTFDDYCSSCWYIELTGDKPSPEAILRKVIRDDLLLRGAGSDGGSND
jgi:hypothetical protein